LLTVIGIFFRGEEWKFAWPRAQDIRHSAGVTLMPLTTEFTEDFGFSGTIPLIMGRREGCLVCHQKTAGFSPAHDPIALGCSSCHGGDPLTLNKRLAHRGMRGIPGNLADAVLSCGTAQCHPSITSRVPTSIMTTASGIVTVDRWVFGEEDSLSALAHIMQIGHSPADQHLRDLCANCHLGNPKTESGPVNQQTRGGGCNACHLGYDRRSIASLADYLSTGLIQLSDTFYHPSLSLNITDEHCFGCHSRSGRIATNYQGWHETLLDAAEMPGDGRYRLLEDQRVFKFAGADVHHQKGLQCIDCHHSYELMGDGNYYAHKEEQVSVSCQDCHFDREPVNLTVEQLDDEALKILSLRQWAVEGKRFVKPAGSDYALVNAWLDREGRGWQKIKATGREVYLKPPVSECTRGEGHSTLSCESCHTAWVPQCIGCHNAFDRDADGYDMLEGKDKRGSWVEYVGQFMHGPPTLGIVETSAGKQVKTFVPGMILSIDTLSYLYEQATAKDKDMIFRRLFAPVSAHTTIRQGRSCKSCHNDPVALGYGQGLLVYEITGRSGEWRFTPRFAANRFDGLPEDAWIGFLSEPQGAMATREHARPFSRAEQIRILTVGACLSCHEEGSAVMVASLEDFEALKRSISHRCILPRWD
jgi:hypothetical protein